MRRINTVLLIILDVIILAFAYRLSYMLRFESGYFTNLLPSYLDPVPIIMLSTFWVILFAARNMYRTPVALSRFDEMVRCFKASVWGIAIIFITTYEPGTGESLTRLFLLNYGLIVFVSVSVSRMLFRTFQRHQRIRGVGLWNAVIVSKGATGKKLYAQLHDYPVWGFNIVGFIKLPENDADGDSASPEDSDGKLLGRLEDLPDVISRNKIEWVLAAPDDQAHALLLKIFDSSTHLKVRFMIVASYYQMVIGLVRTTTIHGLPLIEVIPRLVPLYVRWIKRTIDIVCSLIMLTLFCMFIPILAVVVRIDSKGPILYRQRRVGRYRNEFTLYKLRSMIVDAEKSSGAVWAKKNDPRITRVGNILRKTHIDEIPQFFNVLMGDMSLVGPRPERINFVEQFESLIPLYDRRLKIRPGITGWAQVRYKYDESLEDVKEKTSYDLFYMDNMSISLDLKILMLTFFKVLRGEGH